VDLAAKLEALATQEPGETAGLVSKLESETTKACDLLHALLEEVPCAS